MAKTEEEFIDVLKMQPATDYVKSLIPAPTTPTGVLLADGSVKVEQELIIGDRSGEAQLTLDAKDATASHVVFERKGVSKSSIGVIAASNDELIIEQRAAADIRFILPANQSLVAKVGGKWHQVAFLDDVERLIHEYRTTVDYDTAGATPTRAECKLAALTLPHFDWAVDDDFYLRQIDRTKMALVKYRALSSSVDEATAGEFWLEKLTLVK